MVAPRHLLSMPQNRRLVKSVNTSWEILTIIQELNGARLTDISNETGLAKSAVHKHLATLKTNNLVVKKDNEYTISLRFLDIAEHVKEQISVYDIAKKSVDEVADETGEVAHFAIEEYGHAVCLYKSWGENAVDTTSGIGQREPMHSAALGKAILANLPPARVNEILDSHGLPEKTANTITDREELIDHLSQVREQGYTVDDEENIRGLRCLGAPVLGTNDEVYGALSVSGPSRRISEERIENELKEVVLNATNVIELHSKLL